MRKVIVAVLTLSAIAVEIFIGSHFGRATASTPSTLRPNSVTTVSTELPRPANRITVRGATFIVERDVTPTPEWVADVARTRRRMMVLRAGWQSHSALTTALSYRNAYQTPHWLYNRSSRNAVVSDNSQRRAEPTPARDVAFERLANDSDRSDDAKKIRFAGRSARRRER